MPSHSAQELLDETALPGGRARVSLRLDCGCVVIREIDARRLVQLDDGRRLAAGKYPCPQAHAVGKH